MRALLKALFFITMTLMLTACPSKKDKKESIVGRGGRGQTEVGTNNIGPNGIPTQNQQGQQNRSYQPVDGHYWGEIIRGGFSQQDFYTAVRGFVSSEINSYDEPSELGYVSGEPGQSTGIRFWGQVETTSGFNPNGTTSGQIRSETAELRIVVWDSYAGQTDASGQVIPEFPVHIKGNASGTITGNQAVIRFRDHAGWVELQGTFNQDYFQGWVEFDNDQFWDGRRPGAAGYLGYFYVKTCGFFKCQ